MTLPRAADRLETAMAEEFENYEARLAEARRAVERWEAEGGAGGTEHPTERTAEDIPKDEPTIPPREIGEATHDHDESRER